MRTRRPEVADVAASTVGPLTDVKVVACSTAQAGTVPYMLMADLGAEVVKIERPGSGDPSRNQGKVDGYPSSYFETNNRGVKSVTLNLKDPRGQRILHELVKRADVFGQNFRPGAADKNGFGYEALKRINPRIVYASVSGYGPLGPNANLPGTDAIGQATGGIAQAYATPGEPLRTGVVSVADETCAVLTFGGILAALHRARTTGKGQMVETSLVGATVRLMGWTMTTTMWRGTDPVVGQARITGTPDRPGMSGNFVDEAGRPFVFQLGGKDWERAMKGLGFLEAMTEQGYGDLGVAVQSEAARSGLLRALGELFATGSRELWVAVLRDADIVAAPINTLLEAASDPDVLANGYIAEIDYPEYDKRAKVHGSPWRFSETPARIGRAPVLGAHSAEVLERLGYTAGDIEVLDRDGVI